MIKISVVKTARGFSLIEAIIYVAILAVLAVTFISLLLVMVRSYTEFRLARDITSAATLGLDRLTREIRQASDFDFGLSVLDVHPGRLVLNTLDSGGAPTTMDFYLADGTLMLKEGTGQAASITVNRVSVDNLVFRQINTAASTGIKVEMTLRAVRGELVRTEKFYATAVLRGSY